MWELEGAADEEAEGVDEEAAEFLEEAVVDVQQSAARRQSAGPRRVRRQADRCHAPRSVRHRAHRRRRGPARVNARLPVSGRRPVSVQRPGSAPPQDNVPMLASVPMRGNCLPASVRRAINSTIFSICLREAAIEVAATWQRLREARSPEVRRQTSCRTGPANCRLAGE